MSDFRQLTDGIWASPQICVEDVAEAASRGFALVINNRPDGESDDQPTSEVIQAAVEGAGMQYCAIPITHAGFSEAQVSQLAEALDDIDGPVLTYCRSGTRSTLLWSLARSKKGCATEETARLAAGAGYDVAPIRAVMDIYAAQASN